MKTKNLFWIIVVLTIVTVGCGGGSLTPTIVKTKSQDNPQTITFVGDSITKYWSENSTFHSNWKAYGYPGETCNEISQTFDSDIALEVNAVHILCGTNDLWRESNWTLSDTTVSLTSMIQTARAKGLKVYVGTIPPWGVGPIAQQYDYDYAGHLERVKQVNTWLHSQPGIIVIDYNSVLSNSDGLYNPSYTVDGVHPDANGFAVMNSLWR